MSGSDTPLRQVAVRVRSALNTLGMRYAGTGLRMRAQTEAGCLAVELQVSTNSSKDATIFAANAGLWNRTLAQYFSGPPDCKSIAPMDCHWWLRAGQLSEQGEGKWWELTAGEEGISKIASEVCRSLEPIVNTFASASTDAALLRLLVNTTPVFMDPIDRWSYALALSLALRARAEGDQAAIELRQIGEKRSLSIDCKALLRKYEEERSESGRG